MTQTASPKCEHNLTTFNSEGRRRLISEEKGIGKSKINNGGGNAICSVRFVFALIIVFVYVHTYDARIQYATAICCPRSNLPDMLIDLQATDVEPILALANLA
jgi:hypothetical protein